MTKEIKLNVQTRTEKNLNKLRKNGIIPACLYGPGVKNKILQVSRNEFEKVFFDAGESRLIDLIVDNKENLKVLIKDFQKDPLKENFIHIDFYQVDMSKRITTEIPLHFIGESRAVKEQGGILVKNMNTVEVKCLAKDLVDFIEVDLSILKNIEDSIKLRDIKLPGGIELVSQTDEVVAIVLEQKEEIETSVNVNQETTVEANENDIKK